VYAVLASAIASAKLFAGTDSGLLVSADGGASFTAAGGGFPAARVQALVEDAARQRIYAGSLAGVFESSDGGATWTPLGDGLTNPQVFCLALLPDGTLLAGTRAGSVFRLVATAERESTPRADPRSGTREVAPRP
jgi:photosystem II stability/assembly factor-like uncharacterized protein